MKRWLPLLLVCLSAWRADARDAATPLPRAHAHNDYEHTRPLLDALDQGFCSVEADIFLKDGTFLVAHSVIDQKPERTLQKLYLDPLRARVKANNGRVYPNGPPFYLLIDVKSDAKATYAALAPLLAEYSDILSETRAGKTNGKAVTVVISGNCDREAIGAATVRHAAIDGRPKDLDGKAPAALVPWVSASWGSLFQWKGTGAMPEAERAKLKEYVNKAHVQGRLVRFWAAPDNATSWAEQHAAGVDLINTDHLAELGKFLRDQPPTVTAKAWAIIDGKSGRLLWGKNAEQPMKSASTTKIMCARVVLQLAAKDPKVLDEVVTFSKLADDTPGSTADVRVGESLPVKELLYGLLLPSGNDAGNAFGEHFNDRLLPPEPALAKSAGLDPAKIGSRINFIAEMNREAQKLGLTHTIYRSTYGDGGTDADRTTTAHDLGLLAWQTMKDFELFRTVVATKSYECAVRTDAGGTRTAKWKNTNNLLGKPGYDGVKTGTTNQAGACLVSSGRRGNEHLIVVVLGSKVSADRFTDSEALYQWAWGRRP